MNNKGLAVRWTIGDVSDPGFEALALSIRSARKLFGPESEYAVCVNSLSLSVAKDRLGAIARQVQWIHAAQHVPGWLRDQLDENMAEGVAWKLAPVRLFPDRYELSLDNDLILWQIPVAIQQWMYSSDPESCVMAEDAQRCLGQFSDCGDARAINSGIRGIPPNFDLEERLRKELQKKGVILRSELDEQGLQAAVLSRAHLALVSREEVSICSPFPMHQQSLGRCGAHFVGLNQRFLPWELEGRGAHEVIQERWRAYQKDLTKLVDEIEPIGRQEGELVSR